jgi:superfamily II DNA helicase RecQ
MIQNDRDRDRPSAEEIKRQEEGIRAVVQFCQNRVDCRRVQLLTYFGEVFSPDDCHNSCDNCLDSTEVVTQDVTEAALNAIKLVKSLTQTGNVTQNYCIDVFRGGNTRDIKQRNHQNHPQYGAGRHMNRDALDRLFGQLLTSEVFCVVSVQNNSGWHNNYLEVSYDPLGAFPYN